MRQRIRTAVVVNPAAAGGRVVRHIQEIATPLKETLGRFELVHTQFAGHATELVNQMLLDGFGRIVSVGGDGTHNEVVNGFFAGKQLVNPDAVLGLIPFGTGTDFGKTLGVRRGLGALPALANGRVLHIDVGCVTHGLAGGGDAVRYFVNVADFGAGGEVARRVNETPKVFGGFLSFLWGVLATVASYDGPVIRLEVDGQEYDTKIYNVIVANGQYYGGGMHVAPNARLDSGIFEVYVIRDVGKVQAVLNLPRLYRGTLLKRADLVTYHQAARVVARSTQRVLLDLDGEQPGQLPATFELIPRTLPILC